MFCERCGEAISEELNFCKRCGSRVNKAEAAATGLDKSRIIIFLTISVAVVAFLGFAFMAGLVAMFLDRGADSRTIVFVTFALAAAIFGICYSLIQQLSKVIDSSSLSGRQNKETAPQNILSPAETAQLAPSMAAPASVAENTTRTLDEAFIKR